MTDRPMTGEEREEALSIAKTIADAAAHYKAASEAEPVPNARGIKVFDFDAARAPLNKILRNNPERQLKILARALLSAFAAVRGMREAAVHAANTAQLPENYQWGEDAMEAFNFGKTCAANAVEAALSGIETEQKQARSPSALSASASTLSKDTTK